MGRNTHRYVVTWAVAQRLFWVVDVDALYRFNDDGDPH